MDKKAILAVVLSLGIWVTWQKFYLEPIQKQQAEAQQAQEQSAATATQRADTKAELDARGVFPKSERKKEHLRAVSTQVLENADTKMVVSNDVFAVKAWDLKSFSKTLEAKDDKVTMEEATGFNSQFGLRFSEASYTDAVNTVWDSLSQPSPDTAVARLSTPEIQVERTVSLASQGYGATAEYRFKFLKEPPKYVFLDLYGAKNRKTDKEGSIFGQAPDKVHVTFRDSGKRHTELAAKHKDPIESAAGVKWLGLDTRYFVLALVPSAQPGAPQGAQLVADESRAPAVRGSLVFPTEGKRDLSISTKLYFGPKELKALQAADPVLEDTIDFGWTSAIAIPILHALKWLYKYVQNYGFAIIILTFLIKSLLFPLTYKSMKSMSKISKLQPQLTALREKYKDDREKLNAEMMSFMKTNGYNPVGGCLPIVVQMPIFFALYRVLFNSMELYQAPFIGWIHDLSSPDPYYITPVLLCGLMFLQQKISPNTSTDPMQQKMLQFMPVMFGMFMLLLPAGLNIYMVVNSATSIAQQYFLNRKLGLRPLAKSAPAKA